MRVNDAPTLPHDDDASQPYTSMFQIIICLLLVTFYLMKEKVPPGMTGAIEMASSVVICVFAEPFKLVEHTKEIVP